MHPADWKAQIEHHSLVEFGPEYAFKAAETIQFRTGSDNDPNVQFPVDLIVDSAGRPLVAWTESAGSGRAATGWWARREDGRWQVHPMSRAAPSGVFPACMA